MVYPPLKTSIKFSHYLKKSCLLICAVYSFSGYALDSSLEAHSSPTFSNKTNSSDSKILPSESTTSLNRSPIDFDIDNDGNVDALTDGLLIFRYISGLTGNKLTDGAIATSSPLDPTQIEAELQAAESIFDIDGNSKIDANTDALLILRYLFGLTGNSLTEGIVATDASRSSASDIILYIEQYFPEANTDVSSSSHKAQVNE